MDVAKKACRPCLTSGTAGHMNRDLKQTLKARYEKRIIGDPLVIVDTRLGYTYSGYEFFLEATNLFDERYAESVFARMPGFWMIGGVRFNMDF